MQASRLVPGRPEWLAGAIVGLPVVYTPCATLMAMELETLAAALVAVGCPAEKASAMAAQLDKRARQLATEKRQTYEQAMAHLLSLMQQGWAAKERGL